MKIHIALVGGQPMPVYHVIEALRPEKTILIISKSTEIEAKNIKVLCRAEQICQDFDMVKIDATDWNVITDAARQLAQEFANNEVTLNLQSGTKFWTVAFLLAFQQFENATCYLIDQNNYMLNLKTGEQTLTIINPWKQINLTGNAIEKSVDISEYTQEDYKVASKIEHLRKFHTGVFNQLTIATNNVQKQALKRKEGSVDKDLSYIQWNKKELWARVYLRKQNGKDMEEILCSPHVFSLLFNTGWFEYKVAYAISQNPNVKKVLLNCIFKSKGEATDKNEIDIIAEFGNRLLFVECKTDIHQISDIDKFSKASGNYGGSGSLSIFVTQKNYTTDSTVMEKMRDNNITHFCFDADKSDKENIILLNEFIDTLSNYSAIAHATPIHA